jgi:hypothetical protein
MPGCIPSVSRRPWNTPGTSLFLAGARDELQQLLSAYEGVLAQPVPTKGAWADGSEAQWTGGQSEIAAMLQRVRGHLDYFGNAAGACLCVKSRFAPFHTPPHQKLTKLIKI